MKYSSWLLVPLLCALTISWALASAARSSSAILLAGDVEKAVRWAAYQHIDLKSPLIETAVSEYTDYARSLENPDTDALLRLQLSGYAALVAQGKTHEAEVLIAMARTTCQVGSSAHCAGLIEKTVDSCQQ